MWYRHEVRQKYLWQIKVKTQRSIKWFHASWGKLSHSRSQLSCKSTLRQKCRWRTCLFESFVYSASAERFTCICLSLASLFCLLEHQEGHLPHILQHKSQSFFSGIPPSAPCSCHPRLLSCKIRTTISNTCRVVMVYRVVTCRLYKNVL